MLKSLLIENYALIEKLDISFDDGLSIITGETGAGKSILLGALGLILGQRADTQVLFDPHKKCIIEGVFAIGGLGMEELFSEHDLDYDPNAILRREISPQGKSRAFINDTPVNLTQMKDVAERLIDIHSQHQNLVIGKSSFRYNILDAFAGITPMVAEYASGFQRLNTLQKKLELLQQQEKQMRSELDYFQFQYDELYKAALNAGEFEEIESELEILNNASEIGFSLEKAEYMLESGQENILSALSEVLNLFRNLEKFSPAYAEICQRLVSSEIELRDIAMEVSRSKEDINSDPHRMQELQQRFDLLQKLLHKHHTADMEELIEVRDDFKQKIDSFESLEAEVEQLQKECDAFAGKLKDNALKISEARKKNIPALEKQINGVLKELGMPSARFKVDCRQTNGLHTQGIDEIDFLFSANPGSATRDLAKVASGGELSRLMLAVKSVISMKNLLPTIIFDEIDTGVSGEIGFKMAHILEKISKSMQVISITHLPQVAARGKKHFIVYKTMQNQHTTTLVKKLDAQDRVTEIAKMLGGNNPSDTVVKTAKELLEKQSIHKN